MGGGSSSAMVLSYPGLELVSVRGYDDFDVSTAAVQHTQGLTWHSPTPLQVKELRGYELRSIAIEWSFDDRCVKGERTTHVRGRQKL